MKLLILSLCLYLLAQALGVAAAQPEAAGISEDARQDVVNRLTENVFMGACKYSLADPRKEGAFPLPGEGQRDPASAKWVAGTAASAVGAVYSSVVETTVYMYPPGPLEVERQKQLPTTLTGANALLGTSPRALRWGSSKELMWQIPISHPRQNRAYCVNLARQAGEAPAAFYTNESVRHANTFYVMQFRGPTVVHEVGLVATKCGWVQAVEACETQVCGV